MDAHDCVPTLATAAERPYHTHGHIIMPYQVQFMGFRHAHKGEAIEQSVTITYQTRHPNLVQFRIRPNMTNLT